MTSRKEPFRKSVERWVMEAERSFAPRSFDELVCHLPGVYPTEAREAVDRLVRVGRIAGPTVARLRRRAGHHVPHQLVSSPLPVPHALDFDWRFSPTAVGRLADECERLYAGRPVVLLGAPSVLWALRQRSSVPGLLLDANPAVIGALAGSDVYRARLTDFQKDVLPRLDSSVVVLDPPWYRQHERLFLWAAAHVCAAGATVLISLPADGTRPYAADEREAILRWAGQLGLATEAHESGVLEYLSPPFEHNALAAAGLNDLPDGWRRGDLITFRAANRPTLPRAPRVVGQRWPEVVVGSVRLRFRIVDSAPNGPIDPRLLTIVAGDVLDSVSRRDSRRASAVVWTSGNRIFASGSPTALHVIVRAIAAGQRPLPMLEDAFSRQFTALEERNVAVAVEQVSALVRTEADELRAMGWAA